VWYDQKLRTFVDWCQDEREKSQRKPIPIQHDFYLESEINTAIILGFSVTMRRWERIAVTILKFVYPGGRTHGG
jgi:hypothetical protein